MSIFEGFRFRNSSSPIHKIDPRSKFVYVCIIFVVALLFQNLIPLLVVFFIQIPFIIIAKIEREWIRSMKGAAMFAIIIFGTNLASLYFYGVYESLPFILERALAMTARFIVLVESFSIFFLTTSPDLLGLALEESGVPYEICFAFTTAVRFVPVIAEEAQTITDAQKSRGLELEGGNFIKRIRKYIPILIPLIVSSIKRSLELAEAMESRAWGATKKRTNLYSLKMGKKDYILLTLSLVILVISVYISFFIKIPTLTQIFSL
jgi:energy-coupling factor transport system permease protein